MTDKETLEEARANSYIDFAKYNKEVDMYSFVAGFNNGVKWEDKHKQETLEEVCNKINFINPRERLAYYNGLQNGAKWQQEQDENKYSKEDLKEILTKLSLVNPSHLKMTIDGYGEFPDSYKLTEKGVNHIIEQFKNK